MNGRRAFKSSAAAQTYYIYDGDQPIMEIGSNGATTALNTFGPTGLVSRNSAGSSVFYQFDQSGNTTERLDPSGNVLSAHGCDSFGRPLVSPTSSDPFDGFGAQLGYYTDHETGLELLGHRYYDPGFGRFLNRDPLGQAAGLNQYRYAGNSPLNAWDPSGLCSGGRQDTGLLGSLARWLRSAYETSPMNPMWAVNAARTGYNQIGQFGSDVGYALYGHTPTALANLSRDAGNALMAADGPLGEVGEAGAAGVEGLGAAEGGLGGGLPEFVYRGDDTAVDAFNNGISPKGDSMDLLSHAEDSDDPLSGFVATSPDYNVACGFGNNVYVINPPPNAIDVNATLGSLSPNPWENEIAIPGPVSGSQIRALTLPGQGISILNPGYIP